MKYIKIYEGFNPSKRSDIEFICKKHKIDNWTINSDGTVDVDEGVSLDKRFIKSSVKFRNVNGTFFCNSMGLKSLEGFAPEYCNNFNCQTNDLESLEFGPKSIGHYYHAGLNKNLHSLKGFPTSIGKNGCTFTLSSSWLNGKNPICVLCKMFLNESKDGRNSGEFNISYDDLPRIELFGEYDIIRRDGDKFTIILDRLNDFLSIIGKLEVNDVPGYNWI